MATVLRSLRALLVFTLLTGVLYPLLFTGAAQVVFPRQANGSLVEVSGRVVGSELIGQPWDGPEWFHGRPSAVDYDASASGGSNLGPTSGDLSQQVTDRVQAITELETPFRGAFDAADIPVDLVTASSSGLDPHISTQAALFQAPRIAELRGLSLGRVEDLIEANAEPKLLGVWGRERVNVLRLNLALRAESGD